MSEARDGQADVDQKDVDHTSNASGVMSTKQGKGGFRGKEGQGERGRTTKEMWRKPAGEQENLSLNRRDLGLKGRIALARKCKRVRAKGKRDQKWDTNRDGCREMDTGR
jgi:hypothetical protein